MLTRSTVTPGTVRRSAHGSREVGMRDNSSCVKLVAVPICRASMIGDSPVTVTVSCTAATPMRIGRSTFWPMRTSTCSRAIVWKPANSNVREYIPGGSARKRYCPVASVTNVPVRSVLRSETVTPGRTPPCVSITVPAMVPLCTCPNAEIADIIVRVSARTQQRNLIQSSFKRGNDKERDQHKRVKTRATTSQVLSSRPIAIGHNEYGAGVGYPIYPRDELPTDTTIFLLSPAFCGGRRAAILLN